MGYSLCRDDKEQVKLAIDLNMWYMGTHTWKAVGGAFTAILAVR